VIGLVFILFVFLAVNYEYRNEDVEEVEDSDDGGKALLASVSSDFDDQK
jgi:hypothetical protein